MEQASKEIAAVDRALEKRTKTLENKEYANAIRAPHRGVAHVSLTAASRYAAD
jgi:hypothetical protein